MPTIPSYQDLGPTQIPGPVRPAQIPEQAAQELNRVAWHAEQSFQHLAGVFEGVGTRMKQTQDESWLSDAKIATLQNSTDTAKKLAMDAGPDGSGMEQFAPQYKAFADNQAQSAPSSEAGLKYKMWAGEHGVQMGTQMAQQQQSRFKSATVTGLDTDLDTLNTMTKADPSTAEQAFKLYSDKVQSTVGTAINATEAQARIQDARGTILKSKVTALAEQNPGDFFRAKQAYEEHLRSVAPAAGSPLVSPSLAATPPQPNAGASVDTPDPRLEEDKYSGAQDQTSGPQVSASDVITRQPDAERIASVSTQLETRSKDPLKGIANISKDTNGSRSYGNFGLNSQDEASAWQFKRDYGDKFGLTANPGTLEFNKQWKAAAAKDPQALRNSEIDWYSKNVLAGISPNLEEVGIPKEVAADPRVIAYFADRSVQQGPDSIAGGDKHSGRIDDAWQAANGSVVTFLRNMSEADRQALHSDFPAALASGVYSKAGNDHRIAGREEAALGMSTPIPPIGKTDAASAAIAHQINLKDLPVIDGSSIQPADIASLAPKDYDAMDRTLRPYVTVTMEGKVKDAVAATLTSGTQNVISRSDIETMKSVLGPKMYQKVQGQLDDAQQTWAVNQTVQNMTPAEQSQWLQTLKPSADEGTANAESWNLYRRATKATYDFQQNLRKDPYSFVTSKTEVGAQAAKIFNDAPQGAQGLPQRERALDMVAQIQRDHGIADTALQVMPKEVVSSTVSRLANAKSGDEATGILNDMRQTYGKWFNTLWGDAVKAGAPEGMQVLPLATHQGQDNLVDAYRMEKEIADASGKGGSRKTALVQRAGTTEKDIKQSVASSTADFIGTLNPEDQAKTSALQQAVEKVALRNMIVNGKQASDAVPEAVKQIYGDNYAVYGSVHIPRNLYDGANGTYLRRGIAYADDAIKEALPQIDPRQIQADPRRDPAASRQDYTDALQNNFKLQTTGDDKGVYVIDQFGRRVHTTDGQPLTLPWEKLIGIGQAHWGSILHPFR